MLTDSDPRPLHAQAVRLCAGAVRTVTPADLDRPTPCAGWSLRDLLAHLTAQHLGFAAAADGCGADPEVWRPVPSDDPVAAHLAAADRVVAAFAAPDALERAFDLPELDPAQPFPGARAIVFHTIDYAVHGWDVAAALGRPYQLPDELAAGCLRVARLIPDDGRRKDPGAAFAPALAVPEGTGPMAEILLRLGRDPDWSAGHPIG